MLVCHLVCQNANIKLKLADSYLGITDTRQKCNYSGYYVVVYNWFNDFFIQKKVKKKKNMLKKYLNYEYFYILFHRLISTSLFCLL